MTSQAESKSKNIKAIQKFKKTENNLMKLNGLKSTTNLLRIIVISRINVETIIFNAHVD